MPLFETKLRVHYRDILDGMPVCWHKREIKSTIFEVSWDRSDVTCLDCVEVIKNGTRPSD